jgi:hypothetical protein
MRLELPSSCRAVARALLQLRDLDSPGIPFVTPAMAILDASDPPPAGEWVAKHPISPPRG